LRVFEFDYRSGPPKSEVIELSPRVVYVEITDDVVGPDLKEHCPNCGDNLKIMAAILEQLVIEKSFTHLGLQARAPRRAPARGSQLQPA
jgi:hypothetical protein